MKFSKKIIRTITALTGLILVLVSTTALAASSAGYSGKSNGSVQAGNLNPKVLPPASTPFGLSYAKWSVKWWQWVFSLPANNNPILDTGDCSVGQSGKVWFLGGAFAPTTVTRACSIPPGKALFFPTYNAWADNTACPYTTFTIDELTGFTNWYMDNAGAVSATIDGVTVKGISTAKDSVYRVGPQVFKYTLAQTDNILTNYFGPLFNFDLSCIADGTTVNPAVEDGAYLMLAPLSAGQHKIKLKVEGFLDITYELTVRGKK